VILTRKPVRAHHTDELPGGLSRCHADPPVNLDLLQAVNYAEALIRRSGTTPGNLETAIPLLACRLAGQEDPVKIVKSSPVFLPPVERPSLLHQCDGKSGAKMKPILGWTMLSARTSVIPN
jgi:hypothetical protein